MKSLTKRRYNLNKNRFKGKIAFQEVAILQNWQKIKRLLLMFQSIFQIG